MKKLLSLFCIFCCPFLLHSQEFTLGWEGDRIIADETFLDAPQWMCNQSSLMLGDSCYVSSDTALHLHWKYGAGIRGKFAQCYLVLSVPLDLSDLDVIGLDVRGKPGKSQVRNVELKFESAGLQASYTWENLAHIDRWCNQLVILKEQFSNGRQFNWSSVQVISFAVTMNSSDLTDMEADSGVVSFRHLIGQTVDHFIRAQHLEQLVDFEIDDLEAVRLNAATALKNRQKSTGLLTTWIPDGSSWLYGQGLALRALTEEGEWNGPVALNDFAVAAENLAQFLASHQAAEGYWPRAWNSESGNILVNLEGDNTVWMGDFPWIPGSLAYYYRKSGDSEVYPAILKAKAFLYDLIEPSGKVNTLNLLSRQKSEVSNYEGYAATLYGLLELGDTIKADQVMDYVMSSGWDDQLLFWKEGPNSARPVLLVNTWLAALASSLKLPAESLNALSMAGKLLYTKGRGEPYGFDGVGPVATWYEGTLSYIAAAGPKSNILFAGIRDHINADGTVPAYNENLGAIAGIWAVDWSSLDATSWLYFAAAQKSPFGYSGADPDMFTSLPEAYKPQNRIDLLCKGNMIYIVDNQPLDGDYCISLFNLQGVILGSEMMKQGRKEIAITDLTRQSLQKGELYILVLGGKKESLVRKIVYR
jgi:hypothetical protein